MAGSRATASVVRAIMGRTGRPQGLNHKNQDPNKLEYGKTSTLPLTRDCAHLSFCSLEFVWNLDFGSWSFPVSCELSAPSRSVTIQANQLCPNLPLLLRR